jgi:hypothetical protein
MRTAGRRACWSPLANGPLMARQLPPTGEPRARDHGPELGSYCGAGDENRTRTISLGSLWRCPPATC